MKMSQLYFFISVFAFVIPAENGIVYNTSVLFYVKLIFLFLFLKIKFMVFHVLFHKHEHIVQNHFIFLDDTSCLKISYMRHKFIHMYSKSTWLILLSSSKIK